MKNTLTKKNIAIVGLMGVGKTTIGTKLAEKLDYYFFDSDQEIEDVENLSIKEIFSEKGEAYFRNLEKKVINSTILRDEKTVISMGGGAFLDSDTRKLLKERATTIWFYASIDEILHRINNKGNRPLLEQKNKRQTLEELAKKRYPIYAEADFKFDVTNKKFDLISNIIKKLKPKQ